jgi:DNA-binding transcriptional regulator/RsmH inhibitor MraZ
MLLAIESTEVAQEHKNGRAAEKSARREGLAFDGEKVEVKVDRHRQMILCSGHRYVIRITEELSVVGIERPGRCSPK